jgi:hypothetical protein
MLPSLGRRFAEALNLFAAPQSSRADSFEKFILANA